MTAQLIRGGTRHQRDLATYYAALSAALRADDIQAVPGLLVLMAVDGWADEAEECRRLMGIAAEVFEGLANRRRADEGGQS